MKHAGTLAGMALASAGFPEIVQASCFKAPRLGIKNEVGCSEYAVKLANEKFGKDFKKGDAWNLRYRNEVIAPIRGRENLDFLIKEKIISPGMLIGIYYPPSDYLTSKTGKNDERGLTRKYTHIAAFTGKCSGEPMCAHLYKGYMGNVSLSRLFQLGTPMEVLDHKDLEKESRNPNTHIIRQGENFHWVAKKHGIPLSKLREFNPFFKELKYSVRPNDVLNLTREEQIYLKTKEKQLYVVQKGDTGLYSIARNHNIPTGRILGMNPQFKAPDYKIFPGDIVNLSQ